MNSMTIMTTFSVKNENTIPNFKNYNISGYAMIRPILGKENITESAMKLKKLILSNNV